MAVQTKGSTKCLFVFLNKMLVFVRAQTCVGTEGRVKPNESETSDGVGGACGRPTPCHIANSPEPLDGTHSKAHAFKEE